MAALGVNTAFALSCATSVRYTRLDTREVNETREVVIEMGPLNGHCCIRIGKTIAKVCVSGEIVSPAPDRPNEGRFFFNVEIGSLANPHTHENGRPSAHNISLNNYVERVLRGSKAIDVESLCILAGKSAWSIKVDVHVLCDDGGLFDACSLGSLCGILNFRHEVVSIQGGAAVQLSAAKRDPVPLSLYHIPISTSFAVLESEGGPLWFADPCFIEEEISGVSILSVAVNKHGELCCIHKPGGVPVDAQILSECMEIAIARARLISEQVTRQLMLNRIS